MNQYEMMLLFDPAFASEFQKAKQEVERILTRAGAEVVFLEKWDERKLAYEIKGRKRGCYVLAFFKCDPTKVAGIERDSRLSESILRVLIKRADHLTEEHMKMLLPQEQAVDEPDSRSEERSERPRARSESKAKESSDDDNELPEPAIAGESDDR